MELVTFCLVVGDVLSLVAKVSSSYTVLVLSPSNTIDSNRNKHSVGSSSVNSRNASSLKPRRTALELFPQNVRINCCSFAIFLTHSPCHTIL